MVALNRLSKRADQIDHVTWSFTTQEPIPTANVHALLDWLPDGVLRAKGFVQLVEDPARRHLLQLVGKRRQLTAGNPWGETEPETRLVFIGLPGSIQTADIQRQLVHPLVSWPF